MTSSCAAAALILAAASLLVVGEADAQKLSRTLTIAYIDRSGDAFYQSTASYTGILRRDRATPFPAAELAAKDAAAVGQAVGATFAVSRKSLAEGEDALAALQGLARQPNLAAVILDLPADETLRLALALSAVPIALFNARHRDDALRLAACKTSMFHTLPSWSMLQDAVAQVLLERNWRRVLVLHGPRDEDNEMAKAFATSARKFGLRIVDVKAFVPGNDPRKRDQTNVRLLTGGADYDAIFVADVEGEFARHVPYNTVRPRPVVGSTGLVPLAWHQYWERHGAPQLNRRFARMTGRPMSEEDWAVWIAVRTVIDAAVRGRDFSPAGVRAALLDPDLKVELYKAFPGSFRPWSRQLRQAILLGTHDTVVAMAPVEGALHQKNNLDTLGPDEPEFHCGG